MRVLRILSIIALIAILAVVAGCERKVVNQVSNDNQQLTGCFACHSVEAFGGAILQAQGEWQNSVHASGTNVDYTNRGSGNDCTRCHSQQGFIDFLDSGKVFAPYSTVSAIHCFTCHAPHETGTLKLRTEAPFALLNGQSFDHGAGNLCANCHHSRMSVSDISGAATTHISNRWGPHHGPQADILQGTNAYEYSSPAVPYDKSTHATSVTDACVGCHMSNPLQHDGYQIGGHSFNMAVIDEESGTEYTLVGTCQTCHSSFTSFDGDSIQTKVSALVDTLQNLLTDLNLVAPSGGEILPRDTTVSKNFAGAVYNFLLIEADRSEGVHNPRYVQAVLKNSIAFLRSAQPSPARPGFVAD